ncbi:shikimate dehydrogenase [Priestia megaterium]|nr:shikimate dehydrogenase [Priestia megaterium]
MSKLYGLIGYPVGHSLSPAMHNDAFQRLKIDARYEAFAIEPTHFGESIEQLKQRGIEGFNVTIPYKVDIMEHLDEIDPLAQSIGAVNTVVKKNGRYIGYNTDGEGYATSLLQHLDGGLSAKNILIIGAGGAAKAIFYTLASHSDAPAAFFICNRTVAKAKELIAQLPFQIKAKAISIQEAEQRMGEIDVVINTTSVGMYPHVEQMPINIDLLGSHAIVSDIIYNPLETKLLSTAKQLGIRPHNGVGMFVLQGALAFEKWTGIFPNQEAMEQIVLNNLIEK